MRHGWNKGRQSELNLERDLAEIKVVKVRDAALGCNFVFIQFGMLSKLRKSLYKLRTYEIDQNFRPRLNIFLSFIIL